VMRDGVVVASGLIAEFPRSRIVNLMVDEERVQADPEGVAAAEAGGMAARFESVTAESILHDFSLEIPSGRIVGIAGQVGSGASELLRAVAGVLPATGALCLDGMTHTLSNPVDMARHGVCFVPQDRSTEGLFLDMSIADNLTATRLPSLSRWGFLGKGRRLKEARRLFDSVGVRAPSSALPVRALSGGNQQKVLIGRSLNRGRRSLLLLDDPTRGVDVGGRAEIHQLIRAAADSGDAVVFVSTELDELLVLADIVVTMFAGRVISIRPRDDVTAVSVLAEMTHAA
jgi:ABC-type sugar transport system ATPase subunit